MNIARRREAFEAGDRVTELRMVILSVAMCH
jgi:hypothetical protein